MGEPVDMRYATRDMRRAAARWLALEAGNAQATSEHLAAAAARLLDRLVGHLGQIIGRVGIEALWLRAVKLRTVEFPFLDERPPPHGSAGPGESLRACLQGQEPGVITEASVALFATVGGLLVTVIGDTLAWKLLQSVWPDTLLLEPDPQETQE